MTFDDNGHVRDAASLLVLSAARGLRVLMGRRPDSARFMPGVYVFPGGAVEPGDEQVATAGEFPPEDVRRMQAGDARRAGALGVAAVRETFEETGILCACNADNWETVADARALVDLSRLRYLGRALTPPVSRIRFHARFFFVAAPGGNVVPVASEELSDPRWVDPTDPGGLDMPRVTRFMLQELCRRLQLAARPAATPSYHRDGDVYQVGFDPGAGD